MLKLFELWIVSLEHTNTKTNNKIICFIFKFIFKVYKRQQYITCIYIVVKVTSWKKK
jgi:hypothetical protein